MFQRMVGEYGTRFSSNLRKNFGRPSFFFLFQQCLLPYQEGKSIITATFDCGSTKCIAFEQFITVNYLPL